MTQKRIKVCILVPGHWTEIMGGAQYQIKCLIEEALKHKEYDITYVSRNYDRSYQPRGYKIVPLAAESDKRRGLVRFISDYRNLKRIMATLKPDIVYQRVGCSLTGSATYLSRKAGFKLIWHVASEADVTPFRFQPSRYLLSNFIEKKMMEYGARHAADIVVQTQDQARMLAKHYQRTHYTLIPNFHPAPKEQISKSKPVKVVWLANLKPLKQPEYFIQLARDLADETDARFIIIGAMQGSREWTQKLLEDMERLANIDYLGPQSQERVNQILATSHILVNTSQYEGFSNTFIQAWMRQMPVVSLSVNPDGVFDNHPVGFHAKTAENLTKTVKMLIDDDEKRATMGKAAARYAQQHHSLQNIKTLLDLMKPNR